MSRTDWKRNGRFAVDIETNEIDEGLEGRRTATGDWVYYCHLDEASSVFDDTYEEAAGTGYAYIQSVLQVQHVTHIRGGNTNSQAGFYHSDDISILVSYKMFSVEGMDESDIDNGRYMKDRVIYNNLVFRVTKLSIEGKVQQRPTIVVITGTQLKKDELVDQPFFAQYAE